MPLRLQSPPRVGGGSAFYVRLSDTSQNMKPTHVGILVLGLATVLAVYAAETNQQPEQMIRLKVGGKVVAELRVFDRSKVHLDGDPILIDTPTNSVVRGAAVLSAHDAGWEITAKSEELEFIPGDLWKK